MKLIIKLATYEELPNSCRIFLEATKRPFYAISVFGELYVNKNMPGLQAVVAAMETMWQYDLAINDDVDNAYDTIKRVAGTQAAEQIAHEWSVVASSSRDAKAEMRAREWVESVYKTLDDDAWEEMEDAGYDSTFVGHGLYKATEGLGRERLKALADAAFVYGYQLGKNQRTD